jgi:hypothetical protein
MNIAYLDFGRPSVTIGSIHRGGSISKPRKMSVPERDLTGSNFGGLFLEKPLIQSGCEPCPIRPALAMYQHRSWRRSQRFHQLRDGGVVSVAYCRHSNVEMRNTIRHRHLNFIVVPRQAGIFATQVDDRLDSVSGNNLTQFFLVQLRGAIKRAVLNASNASAASAA